MSSTKPLRGVRVLSLALNLPGPAALMRLAQMGASCTKVNPPSGDPMQHYTPDGYDMLHHGAKHKTLDLKTATGQAALHKLLPKTDVLLTSFRPSALSKLGLSWKTLHKQYPTLSLIEVVGAPGPLAEIPGHDLTYQAEVGLVNGMDLPPSLFADMGGALMASEATLKALITLKTTGKGSHHEVALSDAAAWLALPRQLRMTTPDGAVGGAHAGYRVYACKNGRVAVAALEPHFAIRLCEAAGITLAHPVKDLFKPATRKAVETFLASQTRAQLDKLATAKDIPMLTLPR
ncbi:MULTISPECIES: CoA transferase [unclassified Limnohabitans]|jgi:crotonobetainyl-CoA:carnitine CoA-transferase CaiB-like acyl-CoA transferase|uniref:CoA transferase n=1 Tax=unclassified Limnohabitans TaxID=2626134 RepID=UPI000D3D3DDA|nr:MULTISPECIES: CoA transferase [unclassified Limnohabitans]PUE15991.1 CoA transferase [Limnohabitans sp. MMS-10A-192]PUE23770.1 CoA transferase [Limnohabitans sp. MMS-10A-160]